MHEEGFTGSTRKSMNRVLESKEPLTVFSSLNSMRYYNKEACSMKVLWIAPGRLYESFGFAKNSPLLPFFNLAYKKLKESGALIRSHNQWVNPIKLQCKKDNELKPILLEKIVLLFSFFASGICFAFVVLAAELFYQRN